MSVKRVLIVSSNGLFREGLKHILGKSADLELMEHTPSLREAEELAQEKQIDVVILEQVEETDRLEKRADAVTRLLSIPGVRVISVDLNSADMWVYKQERVEEVSVEDLMAALSD